MTYIYDLKRKFVDSEDLSLTFDALVTDIMNLCTIAVETENGTTVLNLRNASLVKTDKTNYITIHFNNAKVIFEVVSINDSQWRIIMEVQQT